MMQESVYCKLAQNSTMAESIIENIKKNKTGRWIGSGVEDNRKAIWENGIYRWYEKSEILDSDERVVII